MLLHPTFFIGGEVGDAYWDIPWRAGRHPHRDPELLARQVAQVSELARRWRGDPAILAWDLTDEPPLWLFTDTTDDDARGWTAALAGALRSVDPDHLVTIGSASQEIGVGPFRADVVAEWLDFTTVHPYPTYNPELVPDSLLSPRMTHSAAFETALAGGAGRPVMLHEYGVSSAQFDPDLAAAYDRLLAWSSFGRGAIGFLAWCWTDAEPAAYRRAPYVRQPHETQFGVTDHQGTLRPRGRVLAEMATVLSLLGDDLDDLAGDGPIGRRGHPRPARICSTLRSGRLRPRRRAGRDLRAGRAHVDAGARPSAARPSLAQRFRHGGAGRVVRRLRARVARRPLARDPTAHRPGAVDVDDVVAVPRPDQLLAGRARAFRSRRRAVAVDGRPTPRCPT